VIDACTRNSQMERVAQLLQQMKSHSLKPNIITYSTLIKGYCQTHDMKSALGMLTEMRTESLKPDEIVYNTLLDGCTQAGLVAEGERLLSDMMAAGLVPTNYSLTCIVKMLGQSRRVDQAFQVVEDVTRKYRFKTNTHVVSALIQACLAVHDYKRAATVCEQALQDRTLPEQRCFQQLVRQMVSNGSHVQATKLLRACCDVSRSESPARSNMQGRPNSRMTTGVTEEFLTEIAATLRTLGDDGAELASQLTEHCSKRPRNDRYSAGAQSSNARSWKSQGSRKPHGAGGNSWGSTWGQ